MTQRYKNPVAHACMGQGNCPECGQAPEKHIESAAFWIPRHCDLTRAGVADRIAAFREDSCGQDLADRASPG